MANSVHRGVIWRRIRCFVAGVGLLVTIPTHAQERDRRGVLHVAPEGDKNVTSKPEVLDGLAKMSRMSHLTFAKYLDIAMLAATTDILIVNKPKGNEAVWSTADQGTVFVVRLTELDTTYNTLRTTERTRAGKVLISSVLPFFRNMPSAPPKMVRGVAVIVAYGKKDFSEADAQPDGEVVCLLVKRESIAKLLASEITDDDFVAAGNVYSYSGTTLSQVRVTLE